jgi:hypothetical protein
MTFFTNQKLSSYPAFTKSNYLENTVEPDNLFEFRVTEKIINTTSNFENYVKAAKCAYPIVHENGEITKGETYWSGVSYDGFTLPAQKDSKDYCKKWFSKGCNNTRQHPDNLHYAEHTLKSCKMASCPKCWVDWVNKQANRSTQRFMKYTENKDYKFRHIVLSPPLKAKDYNYKFLKKWLGKILKEANIKTASVVFHPFRFHDRDKLQSYVSPHFHLIVYGHVTNTTKLYNKTKWIIKNKGNLEREIDIFNCVRYMLSHAGIRKGNQVIRYLGDISYRKLKIEKESGKHDCPYCELPLTIFRLTPSSKSRPPPLFTKTDEGKTIGFVGLYEPSCFQMVEIDDKDNQSRIPFYEIDSHTQKVKEISLYSFEEKLTIQMARADISYRKYELASAKYPVLRVNHDTKWF